jgi:hypothetical protein
MIYPVITLYQPWATWIIRGWKTIETRTHNRFSCLNHKTILIHAGQTTDTSAIQNTYLTKEQLLYKPDEIINGFILGSAYVDTTGLLCGDEYENKAALIYTKDRYGLFLRKIEKFKEPIPAKGEMGIWYFDMETMHKVKKSSKKSLQLF